MNPYDPLKLKCDRCWTIVNDPLSTGHVCGDYYRKKGYVGAKHAGTPNCQGRLQKVINNG
jgi:hypothetical protein